MSSTPSRSLLRDEVLELGHDRGVMYAGLRGVMFTGICLGMLYFSEQVAPIAAFVLQIALYCVAGRWIMAALDDGLEGRSYAQSFWRRILPASAVIAGSLLYVMVSSGGAVRDETFRVVPLLWTMPIALYLLLTGVRLVHLATRSLGMDRVFLLDHFRPERATLIEDGVYARLRHPFEAGVSRLALVFALVDGSVYGFLLAALFVLGWQNWWRGVEEKALQRRFGAAYTEYAERVPGVMPGSARDELALARSLVGPEGAAGRAEMRGTAVTGAAER